MALGSRWIRVAALATAVLASLASGIAPAATVTADHGPGVLAAAVHGWAAQTRSRVFQSGFHQTAYSNSREGISGGFTARNFFDAPAFSRPWLGFGVAHADSLDFNDIVFGGAPLGGAFDSDGGSPVRYRPWRDPEFWTRWMVRESTLSFFHWTLSGHDVTIFAGEIVRFRFEMPALVPTPVPAAVWLLLSGLGVLGVAIRRRRGG